MLTNEELTATIQDLTGQNTSLRAIALKDLWKYPSADKRILPYLEDLLDDETPCLIAIPFVYAEMRWLAAHALLSERESLGINQPVRLSRVLKPLDSRTYGEARNRANLIGRGGSEGILEKIAILRDRGYLTMMELTLSPRIEEHANHSYAMPIGAAVAMV